jgi:two-component system, chemotaxis family, chemotaxis protein CheY
MAKTILIVDDSVTIRRVMRIFLENQGGFVIYDAENGQEGLDIAGQEQVDLFIVDMTMPVMNGIEMIQKLRMIPQYATTPIFVLTTESGKAAAERGKAAGANAWIVKPCKPEVLLGGIARYLN